MKYAWVKAHIHSFPVTVMCKVLDVSKSGYFSSLNAVPSKTKEKRKVIAEKAARFHKNSQGIYGYRKVSKDIAEEGEVACCEETVRVVMQEEGLYSRTKRKFKVVTTNSNHDYQVPKNVLNRDFKAVRPNQKWVADITYVATVTGWIYLATVMDLFSRKIVGWELSDKIDGELVISAMKKALNARDCSEELIHHSDRGVQYASDRFRDLLDLNGIECSMSRRGNCWDNACAESFFSKFKGEYIQDMVFSDIEEAKTRIFWYIEIFYNRQRRHASLGYVSPVEFEKCAERKTEVA